MSQRRVLQAIRRWMDAEVIGRGLCPPLVKVVQRHRAPDGQVDWSKLSRQLVIEDLTHLVPQTEQLLETVSDAYLDFMSDSMDGTAPITRMLVLPDFPTNALFDNFIATVKAVAVWTLTRSPEGLEFTRSTYVDFVRRQGVSDEEIASVVNGPDGARFMAQQVVEGCFNPIQFYGQRATDEDVAALPTFRGPVERYKVIARAPYYVLQFIDPIQGNALTGNLNRPLVHKRNTELARETNLDAFEAVIRAFRPT